MVKRLAPSGACIGFLVLLACTGCGGTPAGGGTNARQAAPPGKARGPDAQQGGGAGDATLVYWKGVNSLPGQMEPDLRAGPKQQVWAFRDAARVIRQNPTLGVDPALVHWSLRMATLLDRQADLTEDSRNPALLAEAFARGMRGDPFGVAVELNQAERAWVADFRAVARERFQLRATLTARYGLEFP